MPCFVVTGRLPEKGRNVEYTVEASSEEDAIRQAVHKACQEHRVQRVEHLDVKPGTPGQRRAEPNPTPHSSEPTQREKKVEQARREWIQRLIDLSRRNNLLYYRTLQLGTLDL